MQLYQHLIEIHSHASYFLTHMHTAFWCIMKVKLMKVIMKHCSKIWSTFNSSILFNISIIMGIIKAFISTKVFIMGMLGINDVGNIHVVQAHKGNILFNIYGVSYFQVSGNYSITNVVHFLIVHVCFD